MKLGNRISCRLHFFYSIGITQTQVTVAREALHLVGNPVSLADAALVAVADDSPADRVAATKAAAAAAVEVVSAGGGGRAGGIEVGEWRGVGEVRLFTDWPCSCVRVRGEEAAVQLAVS